VDWLSGALVGQLSSGTLLLVSVLMILTGRLRPESNIAEVRADRDARLAEMRDEVAALREALRVSEQAREVQAALAREQLELTRAAVDALQGFRSAAARLELDQGGGGPRALVVEPPS
jgi:hypothetical protein